MNTLKRTYIIVALCLIGAGIIYLSLPLGNNLSKEKTESGSEESASGKGEEIISWQNIEGPVVKRITATHIETNDGSQPLAKNCTWVDEKGTSLEGRGRFLGQMVQMETNETGAVTKVMLLHNTETPQHIRVVIEDEEGDYVHSEVSISSEGGFWCWWDGKIKTYAPGTEVKIEGIERRAIFYPAQANSTLNLITPGRTVNYYGQLEAAVEAGGYSIVNEVNLELYLMGVVPSEMPGNYGVEAAKVQAVCARSYAYGQWAASEKYLAYGAHVDNGISSQVYGGAAANDNSSKGVEATWGEVLTYEGKVVSVNYFSTSCGYTAGSNEVWGDESGETAPYLAGKAQYTEGNYGDLSDEEAFYRFITDATVQSYDNHSPWFRWETEISWDTLIEQTSNFFTEGKLAKVVEGDALKEETVTDIGTLQDIYVYERTSGGMVRSLLLIGSDKTVILEKPTVVRQFLGGSNIWLQNGENAGSRNLLPSAFISIEKIIDTEENLMSIHIYGGGYGHGVGMSQNGVKGMVDRGYAYPEILAHYYPGTALTVF